MYKIIKTAFFVVCLILSSTLIAHADEFENIFLIDVSKSMIGYGDGQGNNIFPQVKNAIQQHLSNLKPGSKITIIPFAEKTREAHTFKIDGSGRAADYVQSLEADGSNTNIYGTLYQCLSSRSETTEKPIAIYLFTDGNDNIQERDLTEVINKFNSITKKNPFVWVFYNDLSNKKNNTVLDKLEDSGVIVTELDRTTPPQQLQEQLENFMESGKARIEQQIAKIKKERQKLREERQKIQKNREELSEKEKEIQKKIKKLSEQETQKRAELEAELEKIQTQRNQLESLKSKLEAKEEKLEKAARQKKEIAELLQKANRLVQEASNLEKEAAIRKFEEAIDKYSAILEKQPDHVKALAGLEKAEQLLWQRKNFFEKYWYLVILAAFVFIFFLLVVRRPLKSWLSIEPIRLEISYNPEGNQLPSSEKITRSFLRKRFRAKGDTYFITKEDNKNIPIDHEAVLPGRHARIYRKGKNLFIEKINGDILDENKQPLSDPQKLAQEEYIFLTNNKSEEPIKVMLKQR